MEIKTKFSIGDKVFLLSNCRVIETEITGVSHYNIKDVINPKHKDPEKARRIYTNYQIDPGAMTEEKYLFATKEELIRAITEE